MSNSTHPLHLDLMDGLNDTIAKREREGEEKRTRIKGYFTVKHFTLCGLILLFPSSENRKRNYRSIRVAVQSNRQAVALMTTGFLRADTRLE